jgi:hypothetical protein
MLPAHKTMQRCSCALAIGLGLGCLSCGDCVQRPSIVAIAPTTAATGTPDLVLIVNGNDFQRNSTIDWNGAARTTTFVSSHQLKATIPASDLAVAATVEVTVYSPAQVEPVTFSTEASGSSTGGSLKVDCAGGTSNAHGFAVGP